MTGFSNLGFGRRPSPPSRFELMSEALGHDFLDALPYSCIPTHYDGGIVLDFLIARGWTPPAEEATR